MELTRSNTKTKFYRIDVGPVFGIFVENNIVKGGAPISKWMWGKHMNIVKNYVKKRKGSLLFIDEDASHKIII